MRIATVTGATGFIGVHLVEWLLRQGVHVRCLVRDRSHPKDLGQLEVELIEGDVRDYSSILPAIQGIDAVFHLAGLTSALNPPDMLRTNARGTANVARACAKALTPLIHIVVSSVAAVGSSQNGHPRTEEEEPAPISNYGRSKLAGERVAVKWSAEVPTSVIRPGIVFRERNRDMLPMFDTIDRFRLQPHPNVHSMPLSVIYVHDLVELIWRAARNGERIAPQTDTDCVCGYYFACADEHPTYAKWGRMLATALDRQPVVVLPLPSPIPWVIGGMSELLSRLRQQSNTLNQDKIREASVKSWACSPARAKARLGFEPHRPLLNQLRATVDWYRNNHNHWL